MADVDFAKALRLSLRYEGKTSDDPLDPGGRTNQGVTQSSYDSYRFSKGLTKRDVYAMDDSERDEIYRTMYWNPSGAAKLPAGVDVVVFDGAVNSGVSRSVKWLQKALVPHGYSGLIDGQVGPKTLEAVAGVTDVNELIDDIADNRLRFMQSLRIWKRFGTGWGRRVFDLRNQAHALAKGQSAGVQPLFESVEAYSNAKAYETVAKLPWPTIFADITTGIGSAGITVSQLIAALQPIARDPGIDHTIHTLTIMGVVISISGILWGVMARIYNEAIAQALQEGSAS